MEENYFYIDEAGSLEANSDYFILGCYKTDTPEEIRSNVDSLREEILNAPYFGYERTKFIKQGFHACKNHPDIKSRFYNLISVSNIRAYILLLDKKSSFFENLIEKGIKPSEIYQMCIKKLLTDRLIKNRFVKNHLVFEQYDNKPVKWKANIENTIFGIKSKINHSFGVDLNYNIEVHDKKDSNLSIIDYLNFLFVQFYEKKEVKPRMEENFKIIEPKIALIYKMDKDLFYDKKNRIDIYKY